MKFKVNRWSHRKNLLLTNYKYSFQYKIKIFKTSEKSGKLIFVSITEKKEENKNENKTRSAR